MREVVAVAQVRLPHILARASRRPPDVQPQPTAACADCNRQWLSALSLCSNVVGLLPGQMPAVTGRMSGAQVEDGAVLELAIRLPPAWPLKPADVECRRKVRLDSVATACT